MTTGAPAANTGVLTLEIFDYQGPTQWHIRLLSRNGALLAHQAVTLDPLSTEFRLFANLLGELRSRADPEPTRRRDSEKALVAQVVRWGQGSLLGDINSKLRHQPPGPLLFRIPPEAASLSSLPFELCLVPEDTLAPPELTLVFDEPPTATFDKEGIGAAVRILGVFAVPFGLSPLGLRRERRALSGLVEELQKRGKGVELTVLQYGVTYDRLERALEDGQGWDVVHISGHGYAGGLAIEGDDGTPKALDAAALKTLVSRARARVKLIVLSTCNSAATESSLLLESVGLARPSALGMEGGTREEVNGTTILGPSLAAQIVRSTSCAAVAMRYPVGDSFAIDFSTNLYDTILGLGQPFPRAVTRALRISTEDDKAPVASLATPTVLAAPFASFTLVPPAMGRPRVDIDQAKKMRFVPNEPEQFVGRTGILALAGNVLDAPGEHSGVLFVGMPGSGKTTCAKELVYRHQHDFSNIIWYSFPEQLKPDPGQTTDESEPSGQTSDTLSDFVRQIREKLPELSDEIGNVVDFMDFLPVMREVLRGSRILVVLDNLEVALTETGTWIDPNWADVVATLSTDIGSSRMVLTSTLSPADLDATVLRLRTTALPLDEAALLSRQLPHLRSMFVSDIALMARTLRTTQGHPKLIYWADAAAGKQLLAEHLAQAEARWAMGDTVLDQFLETGNAEATDDAYWGVLIGWAGRSVSQLSKPAYALACLIAIVEPGDREPEILQLPWRIVLARTDDDAGDVDLADFLGELETANLVDRAETSSLGQSIRMHPAVIAGLPAEDIAALRPVVAAMMADLHYFRFETSLAQVPEQSQVVVSNGRGALPYLIHTGNWEKASIVAEQVFVRTDSPMGVRFLVPYLEQIVAGAVGTSHEVPARFSLGQALLKTDSERGERELAATYDRAVAQGNTRVSSVVARQLANHLVSRGRTPEAMEWSGRKAEDKALGPWSKIQWSLTQLEELIEVLPMPTDIVEVVLKMQADMAQLSEDTDEAVLPVLIREQLFRFGFDVSMRTQQLELAESMMRSLRSSREQRGATRAEIADADIGIADVFLRRNQLPEARHLLTSAAEAIQPGDSETLIVCEQRFAELEHREGHHEDALNRARQALKVAQEARRPDAAALCLNDVAGYLTCVAHAAGAATAHRLAALTVHLLVGLLQRENTYDELLCSRLVLDIAGSGSSDCLPATFAAMCSEVERATGTDVGIIIAATPMPEAGQEAYDRGLAALDRMLRKLPGDPVTSVTEPAAWAELAGLFGPPETGDIVARRNAEYSLYLAEMCEGWQEIIRTLRELLNGTLSVEDLPRLDDREQRIVRAMWMAVVPTGRPDGG